MITAARRGKHLAPHDQLPLSPRAMPALTYSRRTASATDGSPAHAGHGTKFEMAKAAFRLPCRACCQAQRSKQVWHRHHRRDGGVLARPPADEIGRQRAEEGADRARKVRGADSGMVEPAPTRTCSATSRPSGRRRTSVCTRSGTGRRSPWLPVVGSRAAEDAGRTRRHQENAAQRALRVRIRRRTVSHSGCACRSSRRPCRPAVGDGVVPARCMVPAWIDGRSRCGDERRVN